MESDYHCIALTACDISSNTFSEVTYLINMLGTYSRLCVQENSEHIIINEGKHLPILWRSKICSEGKPLRCDLLFHTCSDLATLREERKIRDGTTSSNHKYFRLIKTCASSFYGLLARSYPESSLSLQLTKNQIQSRFNPGVVFCQPLSKQSKQKLKQSWGS